MQHTYFKVVVVLMIGLVLAGCGDDGSSSTDGGGGSANPGSVTASAPTTLPPASGDATVTMEIEAQGNTGATVTPDATATRIVGTATNEGDGNTQRATVTPNNDDMPLGSN